MGGKKMGTKTAAVAAILAVGLLSHAANAADFNGKRVTVIVPGGETSALGSYARFVVPFIARHLAGTPATAVRPEKDAASAAKALRAAKPDGLNVLALAGPHLMGHLLAKEIAQQRINSFIPVLLSPKGIAVRIDPALGIETLKDIDNLKGLHATYAGDNPTSVDLRTTFMFELLGVSLKPVWLGGARADYRPSGVTIFTDATGALLTGARPNAEPVPRWTGGAVRADGAIGRDPAAPDLPHFLEVYKTVNGLELSGGPRRAFEAMLHATLTAARGLFLPENTPDDIRNAYRAAVQNMFGDPEFRAGLHRHLGPYPQLFAERARRAFKKATDPGPETLTWIQNYSRMHGGKI
jgi:hypothetical protein